jgi:hypothetical protein
MAYYFGYFVALASDVLTDISGFKLSFLTQITNAYFSYCSFNQVKYYERLQQKKTSFSNINEERSKNLNLL